MTDRELRDELVTLLVAGHETTASELSWGFEQMVRAPEVLERVTRAAVEDDTAYLEATVKEILRRPPGAADRWAAADQAGGRDRRARRTRAGPAFAACIYLVHHDARIYPEPYAFRPERFLDGNPGNYSWIPFGGGCAAASARRSPSSRCGSRCARSCQVEVASALDGARARPALDHAEPATRHADLGAAARARAAAAARRLILLARTRANTRASFSSARGPAWYATRLRQGSQPGRPRPASGARPGCDHALCPGGPVSSPVSRSSRAGAAPAAKTATTPPAPKPSATPPRPPCPKRKPAAARRTSRSSEAGPTRCATATSSAASRYFGLPSSSPTAPRRHS